MALEQNLNQLRHLSQSKTVIQFQFQVSTSE